MKAHFDRLSSEVSKVTTRMYSTSFSLGIYFLDRRIRSAIYAIYGFVRVADEIVDSFLAYDRRTLLRDFKYDTWQAIGEGVSANPILNSFQQTVRKYHVDVSLIELFFESMEMDLEGIDYDKKSFDRYILGSAEVVGLMCLRVFTEGNKALYEELKPHAMSLGAAFQKVNFLRDLRDDFHVLGRMYFPNVDLARFTPEVKQRIEGEIRNDFDFALRGIRKLPPSSKGGVYLAYVYYQSLFSKISRVPPHRLLSGRIRLSSTRKFGLMINSFMEYKLNKV
ncbi:MAG TPA: phytoene/squalene synthase family protein [Puia sp.]|nr:phytoene/squalene synthase family protein [Puia sp.]